MIVSDAIVLVLTVTSVLLAGRGVSVVIGVVLHPGAMLVLATNDILHELIEIVLCHDYLGMLKYARLNSSLKNWTLNCSPKSMIAAGESDSSALAICIRYPVTSKQTVSPPSLLSIEVIGLSKDEDPSST